MARKRTPWFSRFITLLTIIVLVFCFIYFFMPDLSEELFTISWNTTNYTLSRAQQEERIKELLYNIKSSYEKSGATADEIDNVLNQIKKDDLINASNEAIKSGANAIDTFVDSLEDTIDFGDLDTNILKNQLDSLMGDVDFSDVMSILKEYVQGGFGDLELVVKDLVK